MNPSTIARRYAKALFELALENKILDALELQLSSLHALLKVNPELKENLRSPAISRQEKTKLVELLSRQLGLCELLSNTLLFMAERGRLAQLSEMERSFRTMVDEHAGRLRAKVVSVMPLGGEALTRLGQALSQATKRNVIIDHSLDSSIIGGMVAQVGSQRFDGSVKNDITRLKTELKN